MSEQETTEKHEANGNISIAFCFDNRVWMPVGVAVTSLLVNSKGKCHYDIYCVVPESVGIDARGQLKDLVSNLDDKSKISFIAPTKDYDDVTDVKYYGTAMFYRLLLHKLLPHLDKVIYYDHDVIFLKDLTELWATPLDGKIAAACGGTTRIKPNFQIWRESSFPQMVKERKCVTSGGLLLNLAEIRESGIEKEWLKYAKMKLIWPDQDILNASLYGKVVYLPATFLFDQYSSLEYEVVKNMTVIHYFGGKPWLKGYVGGRSDLFFNIWWNHARMTPFFPALWRDWLVNVGITSFIKLPSWLLKFLSFFIFKKNKRESFLKNYVKPK